MKKKIYQAPQMNVVIIQQSQSLLAGSVNSSGLDGFGGWQGTYDEDDDAD